MANALIKHGDAISLMFTCVANDSSFVYNYASILKYDGTMNEKKTFACQAESKFAIYKEPYYKSSGDVILTGYGVRLEMLGGDNDARRACGIEPKSKRLVCSRGSQGKLGMSIGLRLMDKHGRDKAKLHDYELIKFRGVGSTVDCNGNVNSPIQCKKKSVRPEEYGFVIHKETI